MGRERPTSYAPKPKQQVPDGLTRVTETTKSDTYVDNTTGEIVELDEADRQADEESRIANLTDDLATRVRDGSTSLTEAETIAERVH